MKMDYQFLKFVSFLRAENWSAIAPVVMASAFDESYNVKLSSIIKRVKNAVIVEDDKKYTRLTIRQYGQGVHARDTVLGKTIGTKRQFVATGGQFIVSGIDARNGSIGIVPDELTGAIVTNDFWLFDIADNVVPQYLLMLLSSDKFQQYWQSKSSGTTNRQRINQNDLLSMEIPLPDITTQHRIVDQYNATIAEAVRNEIFAYDLEESIGDYLSTILGVENVAIKTIKLFSTIYYSKLLDWGIGFSETQVSINSKYEITAIETLCEVNSGGTPSRSREEYYRGNIPWVKTGEVQDKLIFDTEEKITEEALANSSAKLYPAGSLIIAMYGHTRGKTAKLSIEATTNQACAVLHNINTRKVQTDYLWFYMQGEYNRIRKLAVGSAQPNLNALMIKGYPIILPPLEIQQVIVNKISAIKEQVNINRQKATGLREFAKKQFEEDVFGE